MHREHKLIPSEPMGRQVHLWQYGHYGMPLLVFPSAAGMAHEWEAHGMVEALSDWLEEGKLKLYCIESNVAEAWTRKEDSDPHWRLERHKAYEKFIIDELVPFIREDCETPDIPIAATGTSMGAYYAACFALKAPKVFRWVLCLSGRYDITWIAEGLSNEELHDANPMAFLPKLDGDALRDASENTHLTLVCGQGRWEDGNIEDTHALADLLESKGIAHDRDLWGHDVDHEWTWWKRQARYHLSPRIPANAQ